MKNILIVLLVIALLLLIVGAANNGQRVDLDYVFGTWYQVSLFTLIAIAVAALVVIGLGAAAIEGIQAAGQRRKLERELEQTYGRLREAEARVAQMTEKAAVTAPMVPDRVGLPVGVAAGASSTATAAEVAGPDDDAGRDDDAGAADDRTIALRDQPGRDDA